MTYLVVLSVALIFLAAVLCVHMRKSNRVTSRSTEEPFPGPVFMRVPDQPAVALEPAQPAVVSQPQALPVLAPEKKKRHGWLRPEITVGKRVAVFAPPNVKTPKNVLGRGTVVSRGSSKACVRMPDGRTTHRSVKNLI